MNRLKKCIAAVALLACSNSVLAAQFKQAIGTGIQFGGVIGWQGSYVNSNNGKFKMSYGYTGTAFGYEKFVSPNISIGGQVFGNQYVSGGALSANFYLSSGTTSGWLIGVDAYRGYDTGEQALDSIIRFFEFAFDADIVDYDAKLKTGVFLSIGYQF